MNSTFQKFQIERLESRRLFSLAAIADGVLFISGDESPQNISVLSDPAGGENGRLIVTVVDRDHSWRSNTFTEAFSGQFSSIKVAGASDSIAISPNVSSDIVHRVSGKPVGGAKQLQSGTFTFFFENPDKPGTLITAEEYAAKTLASK